MLVSLTPGSPPTIESDGHACCKSDPDSRHAPKKNDCGGGPSAMPCCRIIPAVVDTAPELIGQTFVIQAAAAAPASLHSLSEPEAIFHPPRV